MIVFEDGHTLRTKKETEVPTREGTALVTLALAGCVFWIWVIAMAYSMGRDKEARLTIQALEKAEYAVVLLERCTDLSARVIHEVFEADIYLWERIQALADR